MKRFLILLALLIMPSVCAENVSTVSDYYVATPNAYGDGGLIRTIDSTVDYTTLTINTSVEKLTTTTPNNGAMLCVATYNNGVLQSIGIDKQDTAQNITRLSVALSNAQMVDGAKVNAYVWDGNQNPLCAPTSFSVKAHVDDAYLIDMDTIRNRIIAESNLYSTSTNPSTLMSKVDANGKFTDIDYSYTSEKSTWPPSNVFPNVNKMAQAYFSPGNAYYHNAELKKKIDLVLNDWAKNKYTSVNWWFNEISVPQSLSTLLLYPFDETEPYLPTLKALALKGVPTVDNTKPHKCSDTGGNLTDKLQIAIKIAAAVRDTDVMKNTVSYLLNNELSIFSSTKGTEGIMADYTLHQHGSFFYDGSYGSVFTTGVNKLLNYLTDTVYMVGDDALNTYTDYIVNGHSWFFKCDMSDYNAFGRAISRSGGVGKSIKTDTQGAVAVLEKQPHIQNRLAMLRLKANRLNDSSDNKTTAARHFFLSDMTVMQRPKLYVGVRTSSSRNVNTEYMNNENSKAMYISDGNTTLMRTGKEYSGIFAVWDWSRIPGTTTEYFSTVPTMGVTYQYGVSDFVGGVDDGVNAVSAMNYGRRGVSARKAYFMFGDGMTALGANINGTTTGKEVCTTINQCAMSGTAYYYDSAERSVRTATNKALTNVSWLIHNGLGYYFPQGENVTLSMQARSGSWYSINTSQSSSTVSANVFTLYKSHGVCPSADTYDYTVIPVDALNDMSSYATKPNTITVNNDSEVQAVWSKADNSLGVVFWTSTIAKDNTSYSSYTFTSTYEREVSVGTAVTGLESDLTVKALRDPCCVILKKTDTGYELYVSNPKNNTLEGTYIGINRHLTGENATYDGEMTTVYVPFAQGDRKGATTKVTLYE